MAKLANGEGDAMKRWLARSFWLAAWGAWCWAGYGLWRELPRSLGREIGRIPELDGKFFLTCLDNGRTLVALDHSSRDVQGCRVHHWDLVRRSLTLEFEVPRFIDSWPRNGYALFGTSETNDETTIAVDLRTGKRMRLPIDAHDGAELAAHPDRPWVAAIEVTKSPNAGPQTRVMVVNVDSGAVLGKFPRILPSGKSLGFTGVEFIPGTDELAISYVSEGFKDEGVSESWLEVWNVRSGVTPRSRIRAERLHLNDGSMSRNGRYARTELGTNPAAISVFDVMTGTMLLEDPPYEKVTRIIGGISGSWLAPSISDDGRFVFNRMERAFYELGDAPGQAKRIALWLDPANQVVDVDWRGTVTLSEQLQLKFPLRQLKRIFGSKIEWLEEMSDCGAVHDLRTGALLYRRDEPTVNGSLFVRYDGTVIKVDPTPRWGLIALLQAILAAPLLALWSLLRWRKWRMMRAATP
ncbi:MAG TPA: hypothetical protein VNC50_13150 [Planctomycetia bacterium]|nr:hypothetical protein [Planctomycetia bacterium]